MSMYGTFPYRLNNNIWVHTAVHGQQRQKGQKPKKSVSQTQKERHPSHN